jgi:hypothetical protein
VNVGSWTTGSEVVGTSTAGGASDSVGIGIEVITGSDAGI